jgi:hypothetical protein
LGRRIHLLDIAKIKATRSSIVSTTRLMVKIDPWLGWMITSWMIGWSESRYRNYIVSHMIN